MKQVKTLLMLSCVGLLVQACQGSSTVRTSPNSGNDGVLKTGQTLKVKTKKTNCNARVALKPKRYRRITSRDRKRFTYDYITNIDSSIKNNWKKPDNVGAGARCTVQIKQRVDGCVRQVIFKKCNNPIMRKSIRRAIASASPLPVAPHPDVYDDTIELDFVN